MKIPISDRLLACAAFVSPGDRVADIGCDHAYLGIYLLRQGIASSVIAADLREGPLDCAVKNAEKFGVKDKMSFHLSDGVQKIPRDFDSLVCAGMGAETMISILSAAPWLKNSRYRLILQCQTKTPLLRQYLSENGWSIQRESVGRDGKFLYTQMDIRYAPGFPLTAGQCHLTPALLKNGTPEVAEYSRWIYRELEKIVTARAETADPWMVQALQELKTYPILKEENHDHRQ